MAWMALGFNVAWVAWSEFESWERQSPSAGGPRGRVGFEYDLEHRFKVVAWVA